MNTWDIGGTYNGGSGGGSSSGSTGSGTTPLDYNTIINNLSINIEQTITSTISQFQALNSNPWVGQNGVTSFTGSVQTISNSSIGISMNLTINNGVTSDISLNFGQNSVSFLAEGGFTFSQTVGSNQYSFGLSLERGIIFGNSVLAGTVVAGQEFNHIPGWGDVTAVLAIALVAESGGLNLEAWNIIGTLVL